MTAPVDPPAGGGPPAAGSGPGEPAGEAALTAVVERLARRVSTWSDARGALPVSAADGAPAGTRAGHVQALVQRIADAAADLEARPRQQVPVLVPCAALADQLAVVVADLLACRQLPGAAAAVAAATDQVRVVARALG